MNMEYKDLLFNLTLGEQRETDGHEIMRDVKEGLKKRYGEEAFQSWFKHLNFVSRGEGMVLISVPTKFIKEWVCINYNDVILSLWQGMDQTVFRAEVCVTDNNPVNDEMRALFPDAEVEMASDEATESPVSVTRSTSSSPLNDGMTFENFVVDKSNELAVAACQRVAGAICPDKMINPLFLCGGVGLGKTHLMHAIACHVSNNMPWKKVVYLTAENFMRQFIGAIRNKNVRTLQDDLRSADILMIDDIQFISGKEYTQEEFFHTFNDLIESGRQLVISADRSPTELESVKDRIRSRLSGGLIADICPTTFELRMGILQKKLDEEHISVPYEVLEYLANNITSNVRELGGILNKIILTAQYRSIPITVDFVVNNVSGTKRAQNTAVNIDKIQKIISEYYDIKVFDMVSSKKNAKIVQARQVAMYIIKQVSDLSLADIGKIFGGRNHTTVMHAVKKIEEGMETNKDFATELATLTRRVKIS